MERDMERDMVSAKELGRYWPPGRRDATHRALVLCDFRGSIHAKAPLRASRFVRARLARRAARHRPLGGIVARSPRIAQWYGYTVCLVAVITFLLSAQGVVNQAFTLIDPLRSSSRYGSSLSSFEAFEATQDMSPRRVQADSVAPPTESELRRRYEALRSDQIAQSRFDATRSLVAAVLMMLLAIGLFVWHWRWLKQLPASGAED
jgi:hypothetical protein